jgi:hypothetical protein
MNNLIPVERDGKRVLTTQQLSERYETTEIRIRDNFSANKERYVEGIHYFKLEGEELKGFKNDIGNSDLVGTRVNVLYLWTERGCLFHAKSLGTDRAWEVYEGLVEHYFNTKSLMTIDASKLSPELQLFNSMFQAVAGLEIKNKQLENRTEQVERTLTLVKDTIIQQDPDWRKSVNQMMNKIVKAVGSDKYQEIRSGSYKLLEQRAHCDLDTRLRNLKQRLEESGSTKTKINELNKMDVVESDPKLKEIYASIVKEMMIKYVA